jgi:hypothetical protein
MAGLVNALQAAGHLAAAAEWSDKTIELADASFPTNYYLRGEMRTQRARLLMMQARLDDAEKLASEAVDLGRRARPPMPNLFVNSLEEIQRARRDSKGR